MLDDFVENIGYFPQKVIWRDEKDTWILVIFHQL